MWPSSRASAATCSLPSYDTHSTALVLQRSRDFLDRLS